MDDQGNVSLHYGILADDLDQEELRVPVLTGAKATDDCGDEALVGCVRRTP